MGFLRIFLAIVVLLFHSPVGLIPRFLHPALAVQCFYCISGFYVQLLIYQFQQNGHDWKSAFYKSRILRIFPTYFICLCLLIMVSPQWISRITSANPYNLAIILFNNIFIVSQDFLRFINMGNMTVLPQSWTLSIELMFYFIAPFILTRNIAWLIIIFTISMTIRLILNQYQLNQHDWLYGFFPNEIAIFLLGAMGYRFYEKFLSQIHHSNILSLLGAILSSYLIYFYLFKWNQIHGGGWGNTHGVGVLYGYWIALFLTAITLPFLFALSKHSKIDRYIGELSYPIYLVHFTIIVYIRDKIPSEYQSTVILLTTIVLSIIILHTIEMPMAKLRARYKKPNPGSIEHIPVIRALDQTI